MDVIVNLISNLGFPIAISLYLLIRMEKKLDKLTESIDNLSNVINNEYQKK